MTIFFTADTHFDDPHIIQYENRPFASTEQMNQKICKRWNESVKPNDMVYHLGDFSVSADKDVCKELLSNLNGTKFLIKGNHDTQSNQFYRDIGFAEVYDHPILFQKFFILSHEPVYVNQNMPYANIFGHVHSNPHYRDYHEHGYCVSLERYGYHPVPLEEIKRTLERCQTYSPKDFMLHDRNREANQQVLGFIKDFRFYDTTTAANLLEHIFTRGYCYHFAHMLKTVFQRGEVCWAAPYSHFIWLDTDNTPYDITGVYKDEAIHFIPESYLGDCVQDFLHIPAVVHNTTFEEIKNICHNYEKDHPEVTDYIDNYFENKRKENHKS